MADGRLIEDQLKTGKWNHGLCGCFDNLGICIVSYFVPCVTFGQTRANLYDGEGCCCYGCLYLIPIVNCFLEIGQRGEIRKRRGIPGGIIGDCMAVYCCHLCALTQEAQEAQELQAQEAVLRGQSPGQVVVTVAPGQQYSPAGQAYPVAGGQAYPAAGQQSLAGQAPPPSYGTMEKNQDMARQ